MATGDQTDVLARLKAVLPSGWFNGSTPVLDAVLSGFAWSLAFAYSLIQYAKLQTRIATATDGFLDLISFDYLGTFLPRKPAEQDNPFRARILANLLREKATRRGITKTLLTMTGRTPVLFEPTNPADAGVYNVGTCGYGVAGGYGSLNIPFWGFVKAFRPVGAGIPNVAGYGVSAGAYNTGSQLEYANLSMITGQITDADVFAAVDNAKVAGTTAWVQIST